MVSVIIPVYNCEKYIGEMLESIARQDYKDLEVIIINDGSIDKSMSIISRFISTSNLNIRVFNQKNEGVSSTRNKGIDKAQGDYIIFCDADDLIHPIYISSLLSEVENNSLDTAFCTFTHDMDAFYSTKKMVSSIKMPIRNVYLDFLYNNSKYTFCGFLYKREIIEKYKIRFSTDLKYGEDEEFTWKYLCHCNSAAFINAPLYYYRINQNSASNTLVYERVQVIESICRTVEYYNKENNSFGQILQKMGIPRAKIAILREFSISARKEWFLKLLSSKEYNAEMKNLFDFPNFKIKIASLLLVVYPRLFYYAFKMLKL